MESNEQDRKSDLTSSMNQFNQSLVQVKMEYTTEARIDFTVQENNIDISQKEDNLVLYHVKMEYETEELIHQDNTDKQVNQPLDVVKYSDSAIEYDEQESKFDPTSLVSQICQPIEKVKMKYNTEERIHLEIPISIVQNGIKQEEYVCEICQKVFPHNYSLQHHRIVHSGEKKYNVYKRKRHFHRHKARGETEPRTRPFKSCFKKKGKESGGNDWVCTHCDLTFDNSSLLNLHKLTHAVENVGLEEIVRFSTKDGDIDREGLGQNLSQDCETSEDGTNLQCSECTQIFDTKGMLIQHVSVHGKVAKRAPYRCDLCSKAFSTEERLQKHMLVHGSEESKPLQCDVCMKRFCNNAALSCHIKSYSVKKYYECPFCKEGFDQIQNLKDHVVIHAVNGTYLCPYCQKAFDKYSVVRKHICAFHSEKRYPCDKCDKVFSRKDKLKLHMLRHSNHREFLCGNCGKQFKRKDKLKEHMKRMHSAEREAKLPVKTRKATSSKKFIPKVSPIDYHRFIYKCHTCLVGFIRRGMLVNHLAKRHPDVRPESVPELNLPILKITREYSCQYCEKIYKSSSKRKNHILKNHPGADLPLRKRRRGGIIEFPGIPNPIFSETIGSITKKQPHPCGFVINKLREKLNAKNA